MVLQSRKLRRHKLFDQLLHVIVNQFLLNTSNAILNDLAFWTELLLAFINLIKFVVIEIFIIANPK